MTGRAFTIVVVIFMIQFVLTVWVLLEHCP